MIYQRVEAWLLKPWNAALCLWVLVWGALLLFGVADHIRLEHSDAAWRVGWGWALIIAGLPLSPLAMPLLEFAATLGISTSPVNDFLVDWTVLAAASFSFWLVLVPLAYRKMRRLKIGL